MAARRTRDLPEEVLRALERATNNGLMGYFCDACHGIVMLLESNMGPKACPYCGRTSMRLWGHLTEIVFAPEDQIIADDGSKNGHG